MKLKTRAQVVKSILKWKNDFNLSLRYLYNIKVIYLEDGYEIKIGDVHGDNVQCGLKFYLDYTKSKQKRFLTK